MNHRKHGLRLSGLLAVMALGVMAFAASAQAVVTPGFLIEGKPAVEAKVGAEIDPGTVGTMLVPTLNFQLTCTAFTVDEGVINTTTDAKGVLLFTGCTTLEYLKTLEIPCEVVEPIKAEALILPAELIKPEPLPPAILAEKVKALIKLTKVGDLTKPCTLPEDNTVLGDVCFLIKEGTNDTAKPLIEAPATCKNRIELEKAETPGAGVIDLLKYGVNNHVTLDGKSLLFLTDEKFKDKTLGVSLF